MVLEILKLLDNEKKNEVIIKEKVENILANKHQLEEFMKYPKKKKKEKLQQYRKEVLQKEKNIQD